MNAVLPYIFVALTAFVSLLSHTMSSESDVRTELEVAVSRGDTDIVYRIFKDGFGFNINNDHDFAAHLLAVAALAGTDKCDNCDEKSQPRKKALGYLLSMIRISTSYTRDDAVNIGWATTRLYRAA